MNWKIEILENHTQALLASAYHDIPPLVKGRPQSFRLEQTRGVPRNL